jgi:hypothetical protein
MQPKGHGQAISIVSDYRTSGSLDDHGNPTGGSYRKLELSTYLEYGLTERITIGAQPFYQWAESGTGTAKQSGEGFGDINIFVRHSLWRRGEWVSSVQATAILADAYNAGDVPARGTGDDAYEVRFLAGRNLGPKKANYINLETAYRLGSGGTADQFRADISLGYRPARRLVLIEEASYQDSLGKGGGLPGDSYTLLKAQASVLYFVTDRIAVQAGYGGDLAGEGVGLGNVFLSGLWIRF